MENEIDYNAQLAPSALSQPYQAKEQEEQFPTDYNPNLNQAIGDIDPNSWRDNPSQQVQSYSPEQQQAKVDSLMARVDSANDRNQALMRQKEHDINASGVIYDNEGLANELNAQINEVENKKNLSEADLIANRSALLAPAQNAPDKYEKNYYTRERNTGIAYFDNKKELSILDAYIAKKYIGIDVSYKFLKHDITADVTMKNRNQGTAIDNLDKSDKLLSNFTANSMLRMFRNMDRSSIATGFLNGLAKAMKRSVTDFDTTTDDGLVRKLALQHASIAHKSLSSTDRMDSRTIQKYEDYYSMYNNFDASVAQTLDGISEQLRDLESRIQTTRMRDVPEYQLRGYIAKYNVGKRLEKFIQEGGMKKDPETAIILYAQFQGDDNLVQELKRLKNSKS